MISTHLDQGNRSTRVHNAFAGTPAWCQVAFMFEKERRRKEPTDWGFVLPVWIAIGLFCTLVQVVAFQSLYSALA